MLRIRRTPTTFYPRRSVIFFKTSSNTPVHLFCIAWIIMIIYISYMSFIFICHEIHVNCSKNHILEFTINWTFYQYNIWNVENPARKFEWKFFPFLRKLTKNKWSSKISKTRLNGEIIIFYVENFPNIW